jgi:hypothetical protein
MAEQTPKTPERSEFPWRVLIRAVVAAFGVPVVFGVLIVFLAPNPWGWAATLSDWQTFLAGMFGFTGLIVGAVLNAAETRARDERLHAQTLKRDADIRDADRRALAAVLFGGIRLLTNHAVEVAAIAFENCGDRVDEIPPASLTVLNENASRFGLLSPTLTADVVYLIAEFSKWEAIRFQPENWRKTDPEGKTLSRGTARVALWGIRSLRVLGEEAAMSGSDISQRTWTTLFHRLPKELLDQLVKPGSADDKMVKDLRDRPAEVDRETAPPR